MSSYCVLHGVDTTDVGYCKDCSNENREAEKANIDEAYRKGFSDCRELATMNWRPISEAPKDGTEILGWRKDCGVLLIRYTSCESFMTELELKFMTDVEAESLDWFYADFIAGGRLCGDEIPTHWMPLPEPSSEMNSL